MPIIEIPLQCFKFGNTSKILFRDDVYDLLVDQGKFKILDSNCDYIMTNLKVPVEFETIELAVYFKLIEPRWAKLRIPEDYFVYAAFNIKSILDDL